MKNGINPDNIWLHILHFAACFFSYSTILFVLFFGLAFALVNLRYHNTFSHQTSHTCGPLPFVMHLIFLGLIWITILDLEPNPCFRITLSISKTTHRSSFAISLIVDLVRCYLSSFFSWELWHVYEDVMAQKTEHFTLFYIYFLHIHSLPKTFYTFV